jgi:hypothetical protein
MIDYGWHTVKQTFADTGSDVSAVQVLEPKCVLLVLG